MLTDRRRHHRSVERDGCGVHISISLPSIRNTCFSFVDWRTYWRALPPVHRLSVSHWPNVQSSVTSITRSQRPSPYDVSAPRLRDSSRGSFLWICRPSRSHKVRS